MQTPALRLLRTGSKWLLRIAIGLLVLLVVFLANTTVRASVLDGQSTGPLREGSLMVDIGGRVIHLREMGKSNSGPAVVLLPCLTCDSNIWQPVQSKLAEKLRVYAFDFAGFHGSDPAPQMLSVENAADDLHAALTALGEKEVILVAFSASGITTLNYLARYQQPHVLGVVWTEGDLPTISGISLWGKMTTFIPEPLQRLSIELGIGRLFYELVVSPQEQRPGYIPPDPNYATRRSQRAGTDVTVTYDDCVRRALPIAHPTAVPIFALDADWSPDFAELGEQDSLVLREQESVRAKAWRALAENTPKGRYFPVANSSHMIPVDQPQAVVDAIQAMWILVTTKS